MNGTGDERALRRKARANRAPGKASQEERTDLQRLMKACCDSEDTKRDGRKTGKNERQPGVLPVMREENCDLVLHIVEGNQALADRFVEGDVELVGADEVFRRIDNPAVELVLRILPLEERFRDPADVRIQPDAEEGVVLALDVPELLDEIHRFRPGSCRVGR